MNVSVNGEPTTITAGASVADLLQQFALTPQRVAVEVNRRLVKRAEFGERRLQAGDEIEIVTLVGGG